MNNQVKKGYRKGNPFLLVVDGGRIAELHLLIELNILNLARMDIY